MNLRARIRAGERLLGTFVKTPAPHVVELLALASFDFVVADMEHAPIGRGALDLLSLAGRAAALPVLFRSLDGTAASIGPGLDMGCAGVMAPHIQNSQEAQRLVGAVRYGSGQRGFSPSGRSGGYGTKAATLADDADQETVVLAQIEDSASLDNLAEIAAEPGLDCLFVGPADLARSLGVSSGSQAIIEASRKVARAAANAGLAAGIYLPDAGQVEERAAEGFTVFVLGSDQGLLRRAAEQLVAAAMHGVKHEHSRN